MGLFNLLKKPPRIEIEMREYENGKEVKLKSTGKAEKIESMEYYQTIENEIKPLENKIVNFAIAAKNRKKVDERIAALDAVIKTYYSLESKCASLGPKYKKYFSEMWGSAFTKRNSGRSYIGKFEDELKDLKKNRPEMIEREALHTKESKGLEKKVVEILRRSPGILQTEVYNQFNPVAKRDIQSILYFMEKSGEIRREKSGRTYKIEYIKKK